MIFSRAVGIVLLILIISIIISPAAKADGFTYCVQEGNTMICYPSSDSNESDE